MRCDIYARYSSDMQKQTSINDQIRECRQFDCVVVDDLSRLGRDAGESIHIFQELTAFGIGIASVSDGI